MALKQKLQDYVTDVFSSSWTTRNGQKVPAPEDIKLANEGVKLNATVLYADLDGSTNLVDGYKPFFAAAIYKTYLYCAARIITTHGGTIVSYDGDRIMAVYIGDSKNSDAAKTALKINWAVNNLINPGIAKQYKTDYQVKQVVGIDTSDIMAARTGVRGTNDIVWVGRAANYAAKLTALSSRYPTWITDDVFRKLNKKSKFGGDGRLMWVPDRWDAMGGMKIHRSTWHWSL